MDAQKKKSLGRLKRKKSIKKTLKGTTDRPRLSVFRSSRHVSVQIINDIDGKTIVAASSYEKDLLAGKEFKDKKAVAYFVGTIIAQRAQEKGIKKIVFDRNGFLYHGRIKAVSEGARKAGLNF
jgi:large subunit ribosomal protein L18